MDEIDCIDESDAREQLIEILEQVAKGRTFTITREGRPVAQLVPLDQQALIEERRKAIDRMQQLAKRNSLGGLKIKDLINEGRP